MKKDLGKIVQHGYVVTDVEQAVSIWAERVGAGPFYTVDVELQDYQYRGKPAECNLRIAVGYWGSIQIELIQPLDSADNLYTHALANGEDGVLNHCATWVEDLDWLIAENGLEDAVLQRGGAPGGATFVYLDSYLPDGCHLELIQPTESLKASAAAMQEISREWDGRMPLRTVADLERDIAALHDQREENEAPSPVPSFPPIRTGGF